MKVKIIKSSGKEYWYTDLIGETFEVNKDIVINNKMEDYEVFDKNKAFRLDKEWDVSCSGYYILKKDCEIIEED